MLKGAQGAGKGVLLSHVLKPLFGKKQAIKVENEQLLSQFNAYLQNVMIIAFNEIATSNDERNSIKSKIKAIITDSEIQINEKMIRPYYVENYANCLFYSNEGVPVLIEENDRRFNVVLTGGNISKQDWFQNPDGVFISIRNEMPKFAQYLMNYDYDPQRARTVIQNEEKESLVSAGMNRFEEFAMHLKQNDFTWINENQVPRDNIIDDRKQLKESDVNGKILKDLAHEVFNRIYPSQKVNKITLSKHLKLYGIESARLEGGMLDIRQNYYRWE